MKKLSFFILVLFSSFSLAQDTPGNLQFNRIINVYQDVSCGGAGVNFASDMVIPDGKIWKITSVNLVKNNSNMHEIPSQGSVSIAGLVVFLGSSGANNSANINNGVWWFNSGTKTVQLHVNQNGSYRLSYSAIEFNIVD